MLSRFAAGGMRFWPSSNLLFEGIDHGKSLFMIGALPHGAPVAEW